MMELTADLIMPDKTALIIVDVQNDYCHEEGALATGGSDVSAVREMMPQLHGLIAAARTQGVPVIYIQTFHEKATDSPVWTSRSGRGSLGVCRRGSWGLNSMRWPRFLRRLLSINTGIALLSIPASILCCVRSGSKP